MYASNPLQFIGVDWTVLPVSIQSFPRSITVRRGEEFQFLTLRRRTPAPTARHHFSLGHRPRYRNKNTLRAEGPPYHPRGCHWAFGPQKFSNLKRTVEEQLLDLPRSSLSLRG